jgi:3-oxoacyl-[acyl-carrier protein] reductase
MSGKCVIVTGAGQGIGRAIALSLAAQGARVVVADLAGDNARSVAEEITVANGTAIACEVDVSSPESAARLVSESVAAFGSVEGVVNNAAIFSSLRMRPFDTIEADEWDNVHAVNLRGVWAMVTAAADELRKAGARGSVVNMSAGAVWMGRAGYAHYVSSKAGVVGLTRVLARELGGRGVRVNSVAPGPVSTGIARDTVTPEQKEKMMQDQCIHRLATPDDLIGPVAFLLSDDSAFLTGQTLNVDGGLVLN